ncbi:MAG: hypothetical protein IJW26_06045 [Clostridia bacterium]|nr:hypothetical protein [Clostridia bacterium]
MKNLTVRIDENVLAELKFCAKNLNTTPASIVQYFISDLLADTKEANTAQKWFWQNKNNFGKMQIEIKPS